jgi:two-component system sensor histidine kinase DevS
MALLTREQLEARLVSLHRASLELVSNLSLDNVLERIVNLAREEVDAAYAALGVLDENGNLVQFIPVGMTKEEIERVGHYPVGKGLIGAIKKEAMPIRVPKINEDSRSAGFPKGHPYMESFLGVPIIHGDQILGHIYLSNKQGYPEFTADDEHVLETLAAYAAVAITNARMYEAILERDKALVRQNEDLALLNDVAASLTGSLDVNDILELTLNRVMTYLNIEIGEIYLTEDSSQELQLSLHRGEASELIFNLRRFHIGEGFIGKTAESKQFIVSYKLVKDARYLNTTFVNDGYKSIACFPLIARDVVIGVMCLVSKKNRKFAERQLNVLASMGKWAGITIENAYLHSQARRLAVLEERERIGMDLHDGIIQSIYAVGLALDYARVALDDDTDQARQKIDQAIDGCNKTIRDIRAYISDLRPRELVGSDLQKNIQRLVEEYRLNTLAEATLIGPPDGLTGLPASHATALFHICQEALANVAKHSQARRVDIRLWSSRDRVLVEVADNGQGFDLRKMSITLGHGLSNMHVRARKVGGDVEITSAPSEGTTVLAWVPRRA